MFDLFRMTPFPLIIHVPEVILVMVGGNSSLSGAWVVRPTSTDPAHLSVNLVTSTSNSWLSFRGTLVTTTAWLNSLNRLWMMKWQTIVVMLYTVYTIVCNYLARCMTCHSSYHMNLGKSLCLHIDLVKYLWFTVLIESTINMLTFVLLLRHRFLLQRTSHSESERAQACWRPPLVSIK